MRVGGRGLMIMHWMKGKRRKGREGSVLTQQPTVAMAAAWGESQGLGVDNDAHEGGVEQGGIILVGH